MRFHRREGVSVVSVISCYSSHMRTSKRFVLRGGLLAASLAATVIASVVAGAQAPGGHPISGRPFAPGLGWQGAPWLPRPERAAQKKSPTPLHVPKIARGPAGAPTCAPARPM